MIAVAPSLVRTLDADELDRVLIHEWAHVQRRDDLVNILQIVVRIIAGWHPALWWIDRRLHVEREIACDEITVAVTGSREGVRTVSDEARQPQRHTASHADGASGIHAGRPARTRHQDRVAARVDRAGVVSQYRRSDRHVAVPDIGRSGWTERRGGDGIGAAAGAISDAHHHAGPRCAERAAAALPGHADRPFAASDQGPGVVIGSASEGRTACRIMPHHHEPNRTRLPRRRSRITVDATPAAEAGAEPAAGEPIPSCAGPFHSSDLTSGRSRAQSPWSAAAAGGDAVGRKSKDAGVATAGFFSRFARRVAGSF